MSPGGGAVCPKLISSMCVGFRAEEAVLRTTKEED